MGISIGIDLGTSNSVVAHLTESGPVVLEDSDGRTLQPSVVALGHGGKPVVGHLARQQMAYAPETTVASAKRLMGRRYSAEECRRMRGQVAWRIVEGEQGDAQVRVGGNVHPVQEISAHILRHMVHIAEVATGEQVDGAVITVPAYFNDQQRQATRDAAEIARLNCLRIINEPTAAAMAYGFNERKNQRVVVYDLGGGTFDVSVLHIGDDLIEVVSTAGDTFLGGDDFDTVIADHIKRTTEAQGGTTIPDSHTNRMRLRSAAERVKRALSEHDSVEFKLPGLGREDGRNVDIKVGMSRMLAKNLTMPLLQRSFVVCDDAVAQANLTPAQIDAVLLVGGMTRFPPVKDAVAAYFGLDPIDGINPDEVVAVGAAIQASNLTSFSTEPGPVLLDVTPQTLGIATAGGFLEPLVARNTPIPTMASKVFHTAMANQTEVRIRVYQGDSREARKNFLLGEFVLDGLPPGPRGEVKIRITFALDANGIVNVTAEDSATGNARRLRVEASSNLSAGQVADLRFDEELDDDLENFTDEADTSRDLFAEVEAEDQQGMSLLSGLDAPQGSQELDLDPETQELDLDPETQELALDPEPQEIEIDLDEDTDETGL
jgi:molecular chaperone DnaK